MKLFAAPLLIALALGCAPARANLDLARKSSCMSCHMVDKKVVGPAFQDVARKYADNPDARKILAAKVKKGGRGVWGDIPMPPNGQVKDADIDILIKWILSSGQ